jgi:hypothetical protein
MSEETCNFTIEVTDEHGQHRERCTKPKDHLDHTYQAVEQ